MRPPNCKCHSKNQKMVTMHEPFGVKDCFACHQRGTMQMEKEGEGAKKKKMEMARQRQRGEKVCKDCHAVKGGSAGLPKESGE